MLDKDIADAFGEPAPLPPLTAESVPLVRAGMAAAATNLSGPALDVRDFDADGVPVRLYRPSEDGGLPLLVFLHGGGWMLGDLETHDAMHRQIAARAGCAVLAVGYRLAPEHPFPAGLDDSTAAFRWARANARSLGCDPDFIALGGESAGGNFAAAIALRLREAREDQPLFQILVHPVTDVALELPSLDTVTVPGLTREYLDDCRRLYLVDAPHDHPHVSPLRATDLSGLAPAIVLTASEDPLRDDGEYYAAALVSAGVETLAQRLLGLPHGFLFLPADIPAVDRAFETVAGLVRRYFAGT